MQIFSFFYCFDEPADHHGAIFVPWCLRVIEDDVGYGLYAIQAFDCVFG